MASLGDLIVRVGANLEGFADSMRSVSKIAADAVQDVKDKFDSLQDVGASLAVAGGALTAGLTVPLVGIGKAAIETAASFEQTKIAFTTLMHSGAAADQTLKSLYDFAARTPFQIGGILQSSKMLTGMGFQTKELIPLMRTLGDAASGLGLGQEGMERLIYHMGQIKSEGSIDKLILREMGQMGINAGQMLADGLGKTVPEVLEMIHTKAINADTAIKLLTAGMDKRFGGGMEAQMQSFTGMLSNLKDNLTYTRNAIGETLLPAGKMVITMLSDMSEVARDGAKAFGELPGPVKAIVIGVLALVAAIGPALVALGGLLFSVGAIVQVWPILTLGMTAVTLAFRATQTAAVQLSTSLVSMVVPGMTSVAVTSRAATFAMSAMSAAVSVAIAVFAGWKLGTWASENIGWVNRIGVAFDNLMSKIRVYRDLMNSIGGVTSAAQQGHEELQATVVKLQQTLERHGVTVKQGTMSLEEYAGALRAAAKAAGGSKDMEVYAATVADLGKKHAAANAELKAATSNLAAVKKAAKLGEADISDVAEATDRLKKAMAAAHPELHATGVELGKLTKLPKFQPATMDLGTLKDRNELEERHLAMLKAEAQLKAFNAGVTTGVFGDQAADSANKIYQASVRASGGVHNLSDALKLIDKSATAPFAAIDEAYKMLGIDSSKELNEIVAKSKAAFDLIKRSGVASAQDIEKAQESLQDAMDKAAGKDKKGGKDDFISSISEEFGTSLQKMLDGTTKFSVGFRNMGVGLLAAWGQTIDKMAAQWVAMELQKLLLHVATNAGIVTNQAATASAVQGINMVTHVKDMLMSAEKAAGKAFAAAMDLPFPINAIVAPVAAAGAFAGVLALSAVSAEHGALLPNHNTIGMLHPNEMVLPAGIAKGLQNMIANGGASRTAGSISQTNTFHGAPQMTQSQFKRHTKSTAKQLMAMHRNRQFA